MSASVYVFITTVFVALLSGMFSGCGVAPSKSVTIRNSYFSEHARAMETPSTSRSSRYREEVEVCARAYYETTDDILFFLHDEISQENCQTERAFNSEFTTSHPYFFSKEDNRVGKLLKVDVRARRVRNRNGDSVDVPLRVAMVSTSDGEFVAQVKTELAE